MSDARPATHAASTDNHRRRTDLCAQTCARAARSRSVNTSENCPVLQNKWSTLFGHKASALRRQSSDFLSGRADPNMRPKTSCCGDSRRCGAARGARAALALGPHINNPDVDPESEKMAAETIQKTQALAASSINVTERAYTDALAVRHTAAPTTLRPPGAMRFAPGADLCRRQPQQDRGRMASRSWPR